MKWDALLIAGPTASGKSALAIACAQAWRGTVINADSMQVYRDLAIITARPTAAEMELAPHRLFGTVDGAENFSAGRWARAASDAAAQVRAESRLPVFVGGTGLYFKALTEGLSRIPPVPNEIRAAIRAQAVDQTPQALHAELAARDPAMAARLRPTDPQRILRALEVLAATGQSLATFQDAREAPVLDPARCLKIFLTPDRVVLRSAIDRRFETMMARGALDEVERLRSRQLDPALPVMRAHGVPSLLRYLDNEIGLAEAVAKGQADTRAYAKRQMTWFRHQMPGWTAIPPANAFAEISRSMPAQG
ncbi:MAG: tRNA (adenosine(37)-N6)-dimethylallyltransferase MiaA [Beijerinckiaceae bacterium]